MKIREWYMNEFPTDDLGVEINTEATFIGLIQVLANYSDVYLYLGVVDSLVRERCVEKISKQKTYSKEELKEAFRQGQDNMEYSVMYGYNSKLTEQQWFEQFKNNL